jgi:nondiscriminating glutamyl-tRNA synthetase
LTQVRVRFAPSPTGELHVGGARTALTNWLFARRNNGTFVLRIEDTDSARSSERNTQQILDGLKWLGINWDEGPYIQSESRTDHQSIALACVKAGRAYYDFSDPEELEEERKALQKEGKPFRYDRRGMEQDELKALERIDTGERAAIRFKVPRGETVYRDMVHGEVHFQNNNLDDFVIIRSDGTPTYMLSVVADDLKMNITHVIRGDDHIANTPKQIMIYEALGQKPPTFGHLPLILGKDKKKLSKRHGGNTVSEYMESGYLPVAVFNFLAFLGWNPGGEREVYSIEELVEIFNFSDVGTSSAVFDTDKLDWINSQWISKSSFEELLPHIKPEMQKLGTWSNSLLDEKKQWFEEVIHLVKERARKSWDLARDSLYFFKDPEEYFEKAVKKYCKGQELPANLVTLHDRLDSMANWEAEGIEAELRAVAEELELSAAKLIHPLRIGSTGLGVTPDIFQICQMLGKETILRRMKSFARYLESRSKA